MLPALIFALLAQVDPCGPDGPIFCTTTNTSGIARALFEFAPSDGAGMTTACACSAITGAKGETITFARSSPGTCLKGNTLTGIANGDLVTCSTDQPRVRPEGLDGTGPMGLIIEDIETNILQWSESLDNAAWLSFAAGAPGTVTVTADQAVSPDGTTTADRLQLPSTSAAQSAARYQPIAQAGAQTGFFFLKGNGSSGTIDLCIFNNGASAYSCVACAYTSASWSRCVNKNVPQGSVNGTYLIGNASSLNGGVARGAADLFVWGMDWKSIGWDTSYVKTTTVAVQRSSDLPSIALPAGISATGCVGAQLAETRPGQQFFIATSLTPTTFGVYSDTPSSTLYMYDGLNNPSATWTPANAVRMFGSWAGATMSGGTSNGATVSGTYNGQMYSGGSVLLIGGRAAGSGGRVDTVMSRFKLNNITTGCST